MRQAPCFDDNHKYRRRVSDNRYCVIVHLEVDGEPVVQVEVQRRRIVGIDFQRYLGAFLQRLAQHAGEQPLAVAQISQRRPDAQAEQSCGVIFKHTVAKPHRVIPVIDDERIVPVLVQD